MTPRGAGQHTSEMTLPVHACARSGGGAGEPKLKGEKDRRALASLEFQRLVEMGPPSGTAYGSPPSSAIPAPRAGLSVDECLHACMHAHAELLGYHLLQTA